MKLPGQWIRDLVCCYKSVIKLRHSQPKMMCISKWIIKDEFYQRRLTMIMRISNRGHSFVWDVITYPCADDQLQPIAFHWRNHLSVSYKQFLSLIGAPIIIHNRSISLFCALISLARICYTRHPTRLFHSHHTDLLDHRGSRSKGASIYSFEIYTFSYSFTSSISASKHMYRIHSKISNGFWPFFF